MTRPVVSTRLEDIDLTRALKSERQYRNRLKKLQCRLSDLAIACYHNRHQVVILLEGWDAAGKGGCIRRMVEKLDPRSCHVYPIGAPSSPEADEHYLQRFWRRLPARGHIAIFDRSWYGRVLVERVEGLAADSAWQRAYDEINRLEKMLSDDGMIVIKLFLHISQEEQLKRYDARLNDPRKNWKLTTEDLRNRQKADQYLAAYNDMLARTHTAGSPWHVIAGEHKWYGRVTALETVVSRLENHIDTRIPRLSPEEIREARLLLGVK